MFRVLPPPPLQTAWLSQVFIIGGHCRCYCSRVAAANVDVSATVGCSTDRRVSDMDGDTATGRVSDIRRLRDYTVGYAVATHVVSDMVTP